MISYASYKSKRVVRSILGRETYEFPDFVNAAFTLSNEIKRKCGKLVPAAMHTVSALLFHSVFANSMPDNWEAASDRRISRQGSLQ